MQPHEYSVIGHNRAQIGRYLWITSTLLASAGVATLHFVAEIAKKAGLSTFATSAMSFPISAGLIYGFGYFVFNHWIWGGVWASRILGVPNLSGRWVCKGQTIGGDHTGPWSGEITINQTWDKIWVYLTTPTSKSRSVSASLLKEPGRGFLLMYSYRNEADLSETPINSHVGYCELLLGEDLKTASGEYFNNKGRITFGKMEITKL